MIRTIMISLLLVITTTVSLMGAGKFQLSAQWNHGDAGPLDTLTFGVVDKDGNLALSFSRSGFRLISPAKVIPFAPHGQGPSDVNALCFGMCRYNDDIAFMELGQKIKIFSKKDDTYKWKETKWLKRSYFPHYVSRFLFYKDRWFAAGIKPLETDEKTMKSNKPKECALIKVYDANGKPIATLFKKPYNVKSRHETMDHHLAVHKSGIFLIVENELKVYEICPDKMAVIKETRLEAPPFYKKMPEDFYSYKKYDSPGKDLLKYLVHWKVSYSRVTNVAVEDGYLVLQIRAFEDETKKFAMLFYNADTMKLEKTHFIDDYFIGSQEGKYYFFAHGNPGRDEDIDDLVINIYSMKDKP